MDNRLTVEAALLQRKRATPVVCQQ